MRFEALQKSAKRRLKSYYDEDISVFRDSKSTKESVLDSDTAIPRSFQRCKDRRYDDDEDEEIVVPVWGSRRRNCEDNNDMMVFIKGSKRIDYEDDDVMVSIRDSKRTDYGDNDMMVFIKGFKRTEYKNDDIMVSIRCSEWTNYENDDIVVIVRRSERQNYKDDNYKSISVRSMRRKDKSSDRHNHRKRDNRQEKAAVMRYAYSANTARSIRQSIVSQRIREVIEALDETSILETSDRDRIRIKRYIRWKSRWMNENGKKAIEKITRSWIYLWWNKTYLLFRILLESKGIRTVIYYILFFFLQYWFFQSIETLFVDCTMNSSMEIIKELNYTLVEQLNHCNLSSLFTYVKLLFGIPSSV